MITLYQFHWSHFVEKVRWALDYKKLEWRAIEVEPFSKRQMRHLPCKTALDTGSTLHTVPTIHDEGTGAVLGESSEILAYLEREYPSPALYPDSQRERDEVLRWLPWLDTEIGLPARRLGYTQVALECPSYLASLFLPHMARAGAPPGFKTTLAGKIIAGVLTQRFRFDQIREDRVYERLENCLLFIARRLGAEGFLVGGRFTAADLALAALIRPTTVVPFFRNHPRLQNLYEWRESLLREQGREPQAGYEAALHAVRQRRGWSLGQVMWLAKPAEASMLTDVPESARARNDQRPVSRWPLITGLLWYQRLKATSGLSAQRI